MKFFEPPLSDAQKKELLSAAEAVVAHGQYINGPEVKTFEATMAGYFGIPFVSCNSGTDALVIGLRALGIGEGDEVITPAFTFFATLEAIAHVGATPILADIDTKTFNIDPNDIESRITSKTKALLVVHLFGLTCDMDALTALCKKHNLLLIEDAAQSFGAQSKGRLLGTIGDMGCFSFFPTKNLGGFGDGGGVTVKDAAAEKLFRILKNHGGVNKYENEYMGYNSRLDTMQAAMLLKRFTWLSEELALRKKNASALHERFRGMPGVIQVPDNAEHTYNQYTLLVEDRNAFIAEREAEGMPTMIYYPKPLYALKAYTERYGTPAPLENTEYVSAHVVSVPIVPGV